MYIQGTMLGAVEEIKVNQVWSFPLREADGLFVLTQL